MFAALTRWNPRKVCTGLPVLGKSLWLVNERSIWLPTGKCVQELALPLDKKAPHDCPINFNFWNFLNSSLFTLRDFKHNLFYAIFLTVAKGMPSEKKLKKVCNSSESKSNQSTGASGM